MKKKFLLLYNWLIELVNTTVSFVLILFMSSFRVAFSPKRKSKERKGESVYVLANGPSLSQVLSYNLDFFVGKDVIVVNYMGNTEHFWKIKPKYYVLLDPAYFGAKTFDVFLEPQKKLMENIKKVSWPMIFFVPGMKAKRYAEVHYQNPNIKYVPFNATRITGFKWFRNITYKWNMGLPSSKNVLMPALMLMLNQGYGKVYLYGADFSWLQNYRVDLDNGKIYLDDGHFYGNDRIYLEKKRFCSNLGNHLEQFLATYMIQDYAEYIGSTIINRTRGSFIDAFEYENKSMV